MENNDKKYKTILLVEDDEALRASLKRSLVRDGYTVLTAQHGDEALVIHEKESIDLIITDILMPQKDGLELLMELKKKGATTKVIAMTGGSSGHIAARSRLRPAEFFGAVETLEKPFEFSTLADTIKRALAD